ncbi:UbiX family flavin prenyltransferase [Maridesulfovibrio bastinii]|uniref:UbiX family flavin prenyltransferase n=1 Tax=Maridesulfovibrio bastinii TaxID=47157 RepID=UPI0004179416|nr:UbiX family flavin prenyltransferase [Maridesulfovibrio bastinii]
MSNPKKRIILAVTGASGTLYAVKLAETLQCIENVELHLIISNAAFEVMTLETSFKQSDLTDTADFIYSEDNIAAAPASGSWEHDGMVICPCSMASLSAVSSGLGNNLIHRSADVCLKERRKLILITRETPLSLIHINNMRTVTMAGGIIMPASPGFYHRPETIDDLAAHLCGRILEQLKLPHNLYKRWGQE